MRPISYCSCLALACLVLTALAARADCLSAAAAYQGVDARLLRAIAMQESGMRPYVISHNANGSKDIGLMQINSSNLHTLAHYGIGERQLLDGCTSAYVGAWILARNIRRLGLNWNAVGAYNAASATKRVIYARQIYRQLLRVESGMIDGSSPRVLRAMPARPTVRSGVALTFEAAQ